MQHPDACKRIAALLLLAILCLSVQVAMLYARYDALVTGTSFMSGKYGIPYRMIRNGDHPYKIVIGDLLGVNTASAGYVGAYMPKPGGNSWLLIDGFSSANAGQVTEENFLQKISNAKGIIVADNFCTRNWVAVKSKEIYQKSNLSPGPFCFSEDESGFIGRLIKTFAPDEVILPYDVPLYKNYIANFLTYLDENHVKYRLVPLHDFEKEND